MGSRKHPSPFSESHVNHRARTNEAPVSVNEQKEELIMGQLRSSIASSVTQDVRLNKE